jgi:hypothetical protein
VSKSWDQTQEAAVIRLLFRSHGFGSKIFRRPVAAMEFLTQMCSASDTVLAGRSVERAPSATNAVFYRATR